jgi:PBSX family phage terminase large subunit
MICVDEAVELNEQEYNSLFSRLRLNVGTRQICLATNPGPCSHWLYKRFYLDNSFNREVISAPTEENFLLPKDYLDSLVESYKGNDLLYRKYLKGEWVTALNAIYPTFNREVHVKNIKYESDRYYLGLDFGFTNATAMLLAQVAGSKVVFLEEVYKTKLLQSEIMQHLHDFNNRYKGLTVIYDPSAASLGAQIQHEGINCQKANNEVVLGISRFNTKLAVREDTNEPDLYVNPNCVNFIREIENYQYDKSGSEKPIKVNDHLCDSAKYILNHIYDDNATEFKYFSLGASDDDD